MPISVTNIGAGLNGSTTSVGVAATVPSGALIFCIIDDDTTGGNTPSVVDSGGNAYTLVNPNSSDRHKAYWCGSALPFSGSISYNKRGAGAGMIIACYATGIANAVIDPNVTAGASGTTSTNPYFTLTSGTPQVAGELFFSSVWGSQNNGNLFRQDTGHGWSTYNGTTGGQGNVSSSSIILPGDQVNSGSGTKAFAPVNPFSILTSWLGFIVGFMPSVVPAPSPSALTRVYHPVVHTDVYPPNVRRLRTMVTMGMVFPFPLSELKPPRFSRGAIDSPTVRSSALRQREQYTGALPPEHVIIFDALIREVLVANNAVMALDSVVREVLAKSNSPLIVDMLIREVLGSSPPSAGPIPVFPTLPYGFPVKIRPTFKTTIGTVKSGREIRVAQQVLALWEIELKFEELRDRTQNQTPYAPLSAFSEYETLVENWLMMYGQFGVFAFDAPWDDSRQGQLIGVGDGSTFVFQFFRTWGTGTAELVEPVGIVNQVFTLYENGTPVSPSLYVIDRDVVRFVDSSGIPHPPANSAVITADFSFYYLCRFITDEQEFEEFFKNRWMVNGLKFQGVYWPPFDPSTLPSVAPPIPAPSPPPPPSPPLPPPGNVVPVGGPGGYTAVNLLKNDSFGFAGAGKLSPGTTTSNPANYTSTSQFFSTVQPDSSYGLNKSGWDLWMHFEGQSPGAFANPTMQSDHLELRPGTVSAQAAFMISHFEFLPSVSESYYTEIRCQTGRGNLADTWSAFWKLAGNETTANTPRSSTDEIDFIENFNDQQFGSVPTLSGFTQYFNTSTHWVDSGGNLQGGPFATILTNPTDITNSWNVFGFQERMNSFGCVILDVYFNGVFQATITTTVPFLGSAPGLIMGWNPGTSTSAPPPNVMLVDYVRVWKNP